MGKDEAVHGCAILPHLSVPLPPGETSPKDFARCIPERLRLTEARSGARVCDPQHGRFMERENLRHTPKSGERAMLERSRSSKLCREVFPLPAGEGKGEGESS